jgi:hypothetical protein
MLWKTQGKIGLPPQSCRRGNLRVLLRSLCLKAPKHSPGRGWRASSEHWQWEGRFMPAFTVRMDHVLFEEPLKILQFFDVGQLPGDIGLFRNLDPGCILFRSAEGIEG